MRAGSSVSGSFPRGRRYVLAGGGPSKSWAELWAPGRIAAGPTTSTDAVAPASTSAPTTRASLKGGSPPPFELIRAILMRLVSPTVSGTDRLEELRGTRRPRLDHRRDQQERRDNRGHH